MPYITLQRPRPVVTGSWMKSPIKRTDMPPNVWSGLYIDRFWFWREIGFGCTYYYVLGVPYSCGVGLVFLVLVGNSF